MVVAVGSTEKHLSKQPLVGKHVLLTVALGSTGKHHFRQPLVETMCCWLSLWSRRGSIFQSSPRLKACVVGYRCGLDRGALFQKSTLVERMCCWWLPWARRGLAFQEQPPGKQHTFLAVAVALWGKVLPKWHPGGENMCCWLLLLAQRGCVFPTSPQCESMWARRGSIFQICTPWLEHFVVGCRRGLDGERILK